MAVSLLFRHHCQQFSFQLLQPQAPRCAGIQLTLGIKGLEFKPLTLLPNRCNFPSDFDQSCFADEWHMKPQG